VVYGSKVEGYGNESISIESEGNKDPIQPSNHEAPTN